MVRKAGISKTKRQIILASTTRRSHRLSTLILLVSIPGFFVPWSINNSILADALISGSFDRTIRIWDPRSSTPGTATHTLPERVYQMDVTGTMVVVGLAGRLFHIYDVRKIKEGEEPLQRRESSMKFMTRAVACMSDGKGKLVTLYEYQKSQWYITAGY